MEKFYLPNFLNDQYCHFIKYGENSMGNILTGGNLDIEESMLHQLEKMKKFDR
jgi:hypothetical protein